MWQKFYEEELRNKYLKGRFSNPIIAFSKQY